MSQRGQYAVRSLAKHLRRKIRKGQLQRSFRKRLLSPGIEMLEARHMLAADFAPDIVVGRVLSAYSAADVQNNELKLTYTVYNQQAEDVTGVLLTSTLQSGVTLVDATQLPDQNGQELAWSLGTIPAYGRASVEMTVELANSTVLIIDDGAEAFSTLNARASTDAAPPAVLKANPIPAALLASTVDANTNDPFIQEQAARLDYDPQNIIDFLQDEIGYESYTGSLRGARGTLWSSAGNALDEASLGVALFRASGIPAQYTAGTLSDPLAQQLILSMFSESYKVVGYIPPGTTLADPANDPKLLAETRQHYWIQFDAGEGLQSIDTTFANSAVSQVFGTPTGTFTEVADALRHKISVAVVAETYYPGFAGLIGALNQLNGASGIPGTSEQIVLNRSFSSAALVGHPLTFGHFTETEPVDTIFSPTITTFSPYLVFGDDATPDGLVDEVFTGSAYQEILSGFPLANALVSGQFIDLTVTSPTGEVEKIRRTMADRFGAAVRAGGVATTLSLGTDSLPLSSPYDLTTISLSPAKVPARISIAQQARVSELASALSAAQEAVASDPQSTFIGEIPTLIRESTTTAQRAQLVTYLSTSDIYTDQFSAAQLVRSYPDATRATLIQNQALIDDNGDLQFYTAIDLLRDGVRAIAAPGQHVYATYSTQQFRGLLNTAFETAIVDNTPQNATTTSEAISAQTILLQAREEGIPLVVLSPNNLQTIDTLQIPANSRALVTRAVLEGRLVVIPTKAVRIGGADRIGWYEIDRESAVTIGVLDDGSHGSKPIPPSRAYVPNEQAALRNGLIPILKQVAAFGVGVVTGVLASIGEHAILSHLKKLHLLSHEGMKAIEIGALLFTIHHVHEVFELLLEADPVLAPFWFGFTVGITVGTTAQFHDPSVPPIYVDRNIGTALPTGSLVNAEMSRTGSLPSGTVSGNVSLNHTLVSGDLEADWATPSESSFDVDSLEIVSAVVRDINSNIVGTGTVSLQTSTPVTARITGTKRFTAAGRGEFAVYGNSTGNLDAGGSWELATIQVQSAGTVVIAVDSQDVVLNGSRLPLGKYFLSTLNAKLGGHGVFHSPNFTNSLSLDFLDSAVVLGPSLSSLEIGGSTHSLPQGITFDNYTGSIGIAANVAAFDLAMLGAAGAAIKLATSPSAVTTDQNTPADVTFSLESTLESAFDISAEAPAGWKVSLNTQNSTLTVQPAPGVQSGLFPVRIVARSKSNFDLVAAADVNVSVNATLPGMALELAADPTFTVPYLGAHVPTSFEAQIRNLGPTADTYDLTFPNPPAGFNILRGANSLTVPAGETGFTGIYLEPNGVLPAPGTSVSFTVTATSQSDPLITQTETFTFQMPAVAAVTLAADPFTVSTIPGAPVTADVTIKNVGNVPYNLAIGASLPNGLAISGLTTPVMLAVGQSTTQTVTLTPAAGTPLNTTLTPTFTYGPAVAANQATVVQIDTSDAFVEAGQTVAVSAAVFAGVLQAQQGSIVYVVKNTQGTVVHTSAAVPLTLGVVADTQSVDLGTINTAGFASGQYTIEATVRDAGNQPLPGALGVGKFVVGLPISTVQDVSPNTVAEGLELTYVTNDATVESSVLVSLQPLVSIIDTNGSAINVAVQGNLAYVAGTKEVTIVDLANPANPQIVGSFGAAQLSQDAFNVAQIVGTNLVIGSQSSANQNNSNILVYSLANPLSPQLVSNTAVPYRFITDLLVQGNTAILPTSGVSFTLPGTITNQYGDVVAVNLTNPASPALADVLFNTNGSPNGGTTRQSGGTVVNSSLAYIGSSTFTGNNTTAGSGRVLIVNIADPSNISVAGELQIPGVKQVLDIAIDGNRALVVGSSGGLRNPFNGFGDLGLEGTLTLTVLDVTNPNSPVILGTTSITDAEFGRGTAPGLLQAVSLGGQQFAVSGVQVPRQGPVLVIVDASNPTSIEARNLDVPASVNGLSVSGNFLHASSASGVATYRIDALVKQSVQVSVQVPTGTGVDIADDSFNVAPSQVIAGAGFETLVWNFTLGADNLEQELTWNSDLTGLTPGTTRTVTLGATIDYGGATADLSLPAQIVAATPATQTLQIPVRVVVPGADAIASASVTAGQTGRTDLANRLSDLATALTNLVQDPTSAVARSQSLASLDSVVGQLETDFYLNQLSGTLSTARDGLAAAITASEVQSAVERLGDVLEQLNQLLADVGRHGFQFDLIRNQAIAQLNTPARFDVFLRNTGSKATTYDLALAGVPADVTSVLSQTSITLAPGEAIGVSDASQQVFFTLTPTGTTLAAFGFTLTATPREAPNLVQSAEGAMAVQNEFIGLAGVVLSSSYALAGTPVDVTARVFSALNSSQQVTVSYVTRNTSNQVVFASPNVPAALTVQSAVTDVDLGALDTTNLADGSYVIEVIVRDMLGQPVPGATAVSTLLIGTPVSATLTAGAPTGLRAEFFDFTTSLSVLPDLSGRTPDVSRIDEEISYASTNSTWPGLDNRFVDTFASRHTGFIRIETLGDYTFFLTSDDGSRLWLDGQQVIDNDGLHGMVERSATLNLTAGFHDLRVEYFENGGGAGLILAWSGPGISKRVIPESSLFTAPALQSSSLTLPPGSHTVANDLHVTAQTTFANPLTFNGLVDTNGLANSVVVHGTVAYVSGSNDISVVDISNPASPQVLSTFAANLIVQNGFNISRVVGDRLIVGTTTTLNANGFNALIYDLTDPLNPALISNTPINYRFLADFLVQGSTVLAPTNGVLFSGGGNIFDQRGDVIALDVSNQATPVLADVLFNNRGPQAGGDTQQQGGTFVNSTTAYIASTTSIGGNTQIGTGRILVVDSTDPADLALVKSVEIPGTVVLQDIAVQGNLGLAIGSTGGLQNPFSSTNSGFTGNLSLTLLDITDPLDPHIIGSLVTTATFPRGNAVGKLDAVSLGNGLFAVSQAIVDGQPVLLLVDPSDPNNIVVSYSPMPFLQNGIEVVGDKLYTTSSAGLTIFDIGTIESTPLVVSVQVPKNTGVTIDLNSFNFAPTAIITGTAFDTLVWNRTLAFGNSDFQFTWHETVDNLTAGERRPVTLDTTITYDNKGTSENFLLPPLIVTGEIQSSAQLVSVSPASRTATPGNSAEFTVIVSNPTNTAATYDLSVVGLPPHWASLATTVDVPAQGSVSLPLQLSTDLFASLGERGFTVIAASGDAQGSAVGRLTLVGPVPVADPQSHGVVVSLTPATSTAGQETSAVFVVRITNTGSAVQTYSLSASLPPGVAGVFSQDTVTVPPGASNFREVRLVLTPNSTAALGALPFNVTATSTTNAPVTGIADGVLSVLAIGVAVDLSPNSTQASRTIEMVVTNTGQVRETFDLSVAGPAALVATLATSSVTLAPGQSQSVAIAVGEIDFAVPGSLALIGIATSRTNAAVRAADSADVDIAGSLAMTTAFDDGTHSFAVPSPTSFLLLVNNLGNLEDAYTATIISTTGPVTSSLVGLDGQPTQTISLFRLPGLSQGALLLNAVLSDFGQGTVTVRVQSTDGTIVSEATATLQASEDDAQTTTLSIFAMRADRAEGNLGNTPFTFQVVRSGNTSGPTTVNFAVNGIGTIPANAIDFGGAFPTGQVHFAAGETIKTIVIQVRGDMVNEPDERFTVTLSDPTGGATILSGLAAGMIRNDDADTSFTLSCPSLRVGLNTCAIVGGTPGGVVNLALGVQPGNRHLPQFGVTLGMLDPSVVAQGIVQPHGTAVVQFTIANAQLLQQVLLEAFEQAPTPRTSNIVIVGAPLMVVGQQGSSDSTIDASVVPKLLNEALNRWQATGLSSLEVQLLNSVTITFVELPSGMLGRAVDQIIYLDSTAAGHGWFVDSTPADDVEFGMVASAFERMASAASPAHDRVDLLSVLMHELGHVLGHADHSEGSTSAIMSAELPVSVRRLAEISSTNDYDPHDVSRDGFISALDALLIINALNQFALELSPSTQQQVTRDYDINGDGILSPLDALLVINLLNQVDSNFQAEGEGELASLSYVPTHGPETGNSASQVDEKLLNLLAADAAFRWLDDHRLR